MTLRQWLDTIQCTLPWTLDDSKALYSMIKATAPDAKVDVYSHDGRTVHVRVATDKDAFERTINVT